MIHATRQLKMPTSTDVLQPLPPLIRPPPRWPRLPGQRCSLRLGFVAWTFTGRAFRMKAHAACATGCYDNAGPASTLALLSARVSTSRWPFAAAAACTQNEGHWCRPRRNQPPDRHEPCWKHDAQPAAQVVFRELQSLQAVPRRFMSCSRV